jgi:mono/diheme cytochrome c family protein
MTAMPARLVLIPLLAATATAAEPTGLETSLQAEIQPIFEDYCLSCHGDGMKKGGFDLDRYPTIVAMQEHREVWLKVRDYLRHKLMPPSDEDQPPAAARQRLLAWIDDAVFPLDPQNPDPGHVVLRRLNRVEYQNTMRDLLGIDLELADQLPPDDSGHGFDNIGSVLTTSPAHLQRYLDCARIALDATIHQGPMPFPGVTVAGRKLQGAGRGEAEGRFLFTNGAATAECQVPTAGRYRLVVAASGTPGGDEPPRMELQVAGQTVHAWQVAAPAGSATDHAHEMELAAGPLHVAAAFTNDFYDAGHPDPSRRDRNLIVHSIRLEGPLDGPRLPLPASHRRIFGERKPGTDDSAHARSILDRFARHAFRRPPQAGEVERYLTLATRAQQQDGRDFTEGVRLALEAMLVSPAFLFREEPPSHTAGDAAKIQVTEHALAARLSYFLWSTMPDDVLLELADRGELRHNLDREVDRMLDSPRAEAFFRHFAGQWLQLRDLDAVQTSRAVFRNFDPKLLGSMRRETEMLFAHIIRENLPLAALLDADFTFADEKLARHYGIPDVRGGEFRKVSLGDTPRRGLLGHGSFLVVTSHPTRTSPVLRGKFVLENLLDSSPPPPPPNVPQLEAAGGSRQDLSVRQQIELHRADPRCSACHALMDPIGFGLENFDATGRWRDREGSLPIDNTGQLATGESFRGPDELRRVLSGPQRAVFHRAVASKLLTYALGRGVEWFDKPAIDGIVASTASENGRARAMIHLVVRSVPFQYRRAKP